MVSADSAWLRAEQDSAEPALAGPGSTFFAPPEAVLDPDLFDGDQMRGDVRWFLISTLVKALGQMGLKGARTWLELWVIGSSMSYHWHEAVGQPDVDVTFSADMVSFRDRNPDYAGLSDNDIAATVKRYLKENIAPLTAQTQFGGHTYEVTYFWNPDISGGDITTIHPYAAYDVIGDTWAVHPQRDEPSAAISPEWASRAAEDTSRAQGLVKRHAALRSTLETARVGSPDYHNAGFQLNLVAAQAQSLYDDLHQGRQRAYGPGGLGNADWGNYRWQAAKQSGAADALADITAIAGKARDVTDKALYGGPVKGHDEVLREAMLSRLRR
jgi:hypothetical protein